MKKLVIFLCGLMATIVVNSQQLSYTYDAAGNRISRTIVLGLKNADVQQQEFTEIIAKKEIKIYPNPVESFLTVSIAGFGDDIVSECFIYNLAGTLVMREKISGELTTLDMSSFSSGTYVLQISVNGEKSVWKIVKE